MVPWVRQSRNGAPSKEMRKKINTPSKLENSKSRRRVIQIKSLVIWCKTKIEALKETKIHTRR